MEQNEQMAWSRFLNKNVSLTKRVGNRELYYQGIVICTFSDKLILRDRKLGEIPLSFEGLSVISINEVGGGG